MKTENITETTHLVLSKDKLPAIPACKGGIMESLRFAKFIKPWQFDMHMFEFQGLVTTQPKTRATKPELWLVKKGGHYSTIFASFKKRLWAHCPLAWKSQWQIEKFCEQNPMILKKYHQGVFFLIHRCQNDDLYVVGVEQNSNHKKFDPRFTTYHINFGGGIDEPERDNGEKKELRCFILPTSWRKPEKEKKEE